MAIPLFQNLISHFYADRQTASVKAEETKYRDYSNVPCISPQHLLLQQNNARS